MFIQCDSGQLVNLKLVGTINIQPNYDETAWRIVAETRTSNYEQPAVYAHVSTHATKQQAEANLQKLFTWMKASGLA